MAEKTLQEISGDTRRLHTKAIEAAQRDNTDYAIALFCQILEKEPAFFECRRQLRAAQFAKAGATTTGFFKKMLGGAGSTPQIAKAKMALNKNPAEAMAIAEQVLSSDPNNLMAHRVIADAATALDLTQTLVFTLENMARISPKDKALILELCQTVADTGSNAQAAEKILNDLVRSLPYDSDLVQAQKNLSAHRTLDEGGYGALEDGSGSYRDILKNKDEAVSLEQEKRVQKSEDVAERLIGEYEERLQTEPDNMKLQRSLAELYTQKNRFDEALAVYARIKATEHGQDASLDRAITDTKVRRMDFQLAQLDANNPEHGPLLTQLAAEKLAFQLSECQQRVDKYPTDLSIRFELGTLYFQAGKIGEAIAEFQKAQGNPHKRIMSMSYLAQCFSKRKMFDLAARTLQNAIKESPGFDEQKKDLIYNLGCVFEGMGKKEEAIEQFKIIYESDISYRDVGAKVDAYYAGQ